MLTHDELQGVLGFLREDGWTPLFEAVLSEHIEGVARTLGQLPDRDIMMDVWRVAFDDFASRRFAGKGFVVDAYLDGPGRAEMVRVRDLLAALRRSTPSLYEIVAWKPGRSLTLRDLVRGGATMTVPDRTPNFPDGGMVARLGPVDGRMELVGTALGVPKAGDREGMMEMLAVVLGRDGPSPWGGVTDDDLREVAPAMTRRWLSAGGAGPSTGAR